MDMGLVSLLSYLYFLFFPSMIDLFILPAAWLLTKYLVI